MKRIFYVPPMVETNNMCARWSQTHRTYLSQIPVNFTNILWPLLCAATLVISTAAPPTFRHLLLQHHTPDEEMRTDLLPIPVIIILLQTCTHIKGCSCSHLPALPCVCVLKRAPYRANLTEKLSKWWKEANVEECRYVLCTQQKIIGDCRLCYQVLGSYIQTVLQ